MVKKIKTKTQTKYLGVILDQHLNFKKQIDTVKQKLAKATGLLAKLRHYVPKKVLKFIYYATLVKFGDKILTLSLETLRSYKTKLSI